MTIGRVFAHAVQRDFNDFWLMGGVSALHTPYITTSDSFKNGQIDPTGQINNLPTQLRHMDWGTCHVQVDLRMQFYGENKRSWYLGYHQRCNKASFVKLEEVSRIILLIWPACGMLTPTSGLICPSSTKQGTL